MPENGQARAAEWTAHAERTLYSSRWLDLNLVDVTDPSGRRFEHHVVRMRHVVAAVVLDEAGQRLLMLERHRFIDSSWGWEIPVGIVEDDEEPTATASREVLEETGWRPRDMKQALVFQPAIGIADSPHHVFAVRGAEYVGPPTDKTEAARVRWVPVSELSSMISAGAIRDGASLVGALWVLASGGSA